jgi:MFS transporter, UMF1 family
LYDLANQMYPFIVISFVFNPWLVEELGARDAHYTVAFAVSMFIALLSAPVIGAVTDRIGRRPVLVITTLIAVGSIGLLGIGQVLGLPPEGVVLIALLFFVTANLGFQLGVVAYDAFLPMVSKKETLGRIGGMGIAVGYLGSVVALVLMFFVLEVVGLSEPVLFVAAAVVFLGFALPALLFLRDDVPDRTPLPALMRASFASAVDAVRHLPKDKVLSRFLLTRFFYADAINTMILVMGVYAVAEVGFERDAVGYYVLLGLGIVFAVLSAPLWGLLVDRIGPRHTLVFVLMGWCVVFLVVAIHPVLGLPQELFYLIGALVGVFLAGTWTSDRPLLIGVAPPERVGEWFGLYALAGRFAAITGPLTWALVVDGFFADTPGARQFGILSILATMLIAVFLLRRLPDPYLPGRGPLAGLAPWGDGSGRPLPRPWYLPVRAPFVLLYLVVTWVIFFVALSPRPHPDPGVILHIPLEQIEGLYYHLPDLFTAPHLALMTALTAPIVNVHLVQLVYVTLLLVLFGIIFEVREGTTRFVAVFMGTSVFGALVASLLHFVLYPGLIDHEILRQAERMAWTGGSAGAFGIMGAIAARARTWWPLLAFFTVWEINVGWWYLQSYTPAFHLSALFAGFLLTRFVLPHKAPPGTRTWEEDGPKEDRLVEPEVAETG